MYGVLTTACVQTSGTSSSIQIATLLEVVFGNKLTSLLKKKKKKKKNCYFKTVQFSHAAITLYC